MYAIGKSSFRGDLRSDEAALLQEYFVYFKKERRRQGGNHPEDAEDNCMHGCVKEKAGRVPITECSLFFQIG